MAKENLTGGLKFNFYKDESSPSPVENSELEIQQYAKKIESPQIRYLYAIRALHTAGDPRGRTLNDEELAYLDTYAQKGNFSERELQRLEELVPDVELGGFLKFDE